MAKVAYKEKQEPVFKQVSKPAKTGDTVCVGCKFGPGFQLQLYKFVKIRGQSQTGIIEEEVAQPIGQSVFIIGPSREIGRDPKAPIEGGAALTFGVSRDFWEAWLEQNKLHPAVVNGLLFAHPSDAKGMAKEREGLRTGIEPIAQENDPRLEKRFGLKKADKKD